MVKTTIARIAPLNRQSMEECRLRLDHLIKPLNSLGAFEKLACQLAGIFGVSRPQLPPCSLLLAGCGAVRPNAMTRVFADHIGSSLVWFDAAQGQGGEQTGMQAAMEAGIQAARREVAKGARILGLGTLGSGDAEITGVAGLVLGAASEQAAVVLDDAATLAGALSAVQLAPLAKYYLIGSHSIDGVGSEETIRRLDLKTYLNVGLNLGEGTGAALGISLLKASLHVLNDMKTFGEADVPVAEDGPGSCACDRRPR